MSDELVYPQDISKEALLAIYQTAYMDAEIDDDGDILIREDYRHFVFPEEDGRAIHLATFFRSREGAPVEEKLAYANRVNDELVLIRASYTERGAFCFDYYIPVQGGITKQAIVLATRRYIALLRSALARDDQNVVA
ncbi:MAG: YbjN domain-containing protein [Chloroflexi bacterium]|nr:YbjN domain-containing protein [Chloroflexota bacterium]